MAFLTAGANDRATRATEAAMSRVSGNGHNSVVETLLAAGVDAGGTYAGRIQIDIASQNGHNAVVQTLLAAGADIETSGPRELALGIALERGRIATVKCCSPPGPMWRRRGRENIAAIGIAAESMYWYCFVDVAL